MSLGRRENIFTYIHQQNEIIPTSKACNYFPWGTGSQLPPPPPTSEKELQMKFYIIILITEYCCVVYRHCPINNLPIWSKKRATESWLIGRVELSGGCNAWRSPAPMEKRTCGPPVQQIGLAMEKERMAVLSDW